MRINQIIAVLSFLFISTFVNAQVPSFSWVDRIGSNEGDNFYGACTDPFGNVYIYGGIGDFIDTLGVDTVYAKQRAFFSDKDHNHFLASYDSQGNLRWMNFFGGNHQEGNGSRLICSDPSGNIYCVISGDDTLFILDTIIYSSYSNNVLVKLDSSGMLISVKEIKGVYSVINAIKSDNEGHVYICGYFNGEISFDNNRLFTAEHLDAFIAKYSNNLTLDWLNSVPSTV